MTNEKEYDIIVGLEVHIQLNTNSKLFCSDPAYFGANPNELISAITLAHPGTLPHVNKEAIHKAIQLGISLGCTITKTNYFSRKHYLYPDLPKGFQTTQHINPICEGGHIIIFKEDRNYSIAIHHIHLEEDAGKSIHDLNDQYTAIDYNRAGTPLCELVTEPCLNSSEEAALFLTELRKLIRWIGVSDGNMEEGSLRCDANISIKPKGSTTLGTRVEVKNLNSIKFVKKAIDFEVNRMKNRLAENQPIEQETRSFDATTETTFTLRSKEDAHDYRYFIEPDLSPTIVSDDLITQLKKQLPTLPYQCIQELESTYQLNRYDALQLTDDLQTYNYFKEAVQVHNNPKGIANFMIGPIKQHLNEQLKSLDEIELKPVTIAQIVQLIDSNTINFTIASTKLLAACIKNPHQLPKDLVSVLSLAQKTDADEINQWVQQVVQKFPEKVQEYKKGKKGLIGFFMGEVKKISKGKAEPKTTQSLLTIELEKN